MNSSADTPELSIESLLAAGETETAEFKESFDEEALEAIAAFANTRGGTVLIGVTDHGAVKGVMLGKESIRDWANRISQLTHVNPRIRELTVQGKKIVAIEVEASAARPHPCRGRYFVRVGKSDRQMTEDDLTRMVLAKVGMTWDAVPEPRAKLSDIDTKQLKRFRTLCNQKGRRLIPIEDDDVTVLDKLELLQNGQPTRAAILLFCNEPQRFYPSASIKLGRFRPGNMVVDDREITGSIFDQVEETMKYFREHLQTRFEFHGTPARDVIWEYPLEALREALTNAVCHRDYASPSQTQIRWHDDSLLFANAGGIPPPLTLEKIKTRHKSVQRNQKIAKMFFYAGWIEEWGSGIIKILDTCKAAGLPEPQFEEEQGGLWLTIPKGKESHGKEASSLGLNDRQERALVFLRKHEKITLADYRKLNPKTIARTAHRDLTELAKKGIVKAAGTTRGRYYVLSNIWNVR